MLKYIIIGISNAFRQMDNMGSSCYVRPMRLEDIGQGAEIDREAFSTMWPPTNFRHELQNSLAHYVVACGRKKTTVEPAEPSKGEALPKNGWTLLVARIRKLFSANHSAKNKELEEALAGFAGFWVMADEAHITNIAVREASRGHGIGEQLLIAVFELAVRLNARILTLEVRASNTVAQNLYRKHGFKEVGIRRGYYTDNKEDAIIMTTENVTSASFQVHFQELKQAYSQKWGTGETFTQ